MWTKQYAVKVNMKWKQRMFYLEYGINAKPCFETSFQEEKQEINISDIALFMIIICMEVFFVIICQKATLSSVIIKKSKSCVFEHPWYTSAYPVHFKET